MDPFKDPKFKKLKDRWYKKLAKDGFEDIEDHKHPDIPLKKWHNLDFKKVSPEQYAERTKYYENARTLLSTIRFSSDTHKKIWELHSEGVSIRDIEKQIRKYKKSRIAEIINEINQEWMPK